MDKCRTDCHPCHALDAVSASTIEGGGMSVTLAISIALLTLGSCFASYCLGRESMRSDIRDFQERRRRWEEFDDED